MSIHLRKDTGKWIVVFKDEMASGEKNALVLGKTVTKRQLNLMQ